jgi:hypothetical protein
MLGYATCGPVKGLSGWDKVIVGISPFPDEKNVGMRALMHLTESLTWHGMKVS